MTASVDSGPDVPVRPAATVMIVDDRPDLHVLLLRRRAGSAFVGGMSVFPGGGVDEHDNAHEVEALCDGLDDATASKRLGIERGGLAYWVAAVRETFEEAGVLLANDGATGRKLDGSAPEAAERLSLQRRAVDTGDVRLAEVVRAEGLTLAVDEMHYAARWITPVGPPRRYDTRFFVAAMPAGQTPVPDLREAVHSEWVRPADALASFEAGERAMLPPTVGMLRILASYSSSRALVRAALHDEAGPDVPVRLRVVGDGWQVLLPEDDEPLGRAEPSPLKAWVRLRSAGV